MYRLSYGSLERRMIRNALVLCCPPLITKTPGFEYIISLTVMAGSTDGNDE